MTDEPEFLTLDEIPEIHRDQIERYGGDEGIRDNGLLESAVAMPQQSFGGEYLHRDIFEMAAAYAFHLAENQAFIDGNKRTGLAAAYVFLALNGHRLAEHGDRSGASCVPPGVSRASARATRFRPTHSPAALSRLRAGPWSPDIPPRGAVQDRRAAVGNTQVITTCACLPGRHAARTRESIRWKADPVACKAVAGRPATRARCLPEKVLVSRSTCPPVRTEISSAIP